MSTAPIRYSPDVEHIQDDEPETINGLLQRHPFRYGDYLAKFSLAPVSPGLTALERAKIEASEDPNAIRDTVRPR